VAECQAVAVRDIAADDGAGRERFIRLERDLHQGAAQFSSTIDADEEKLLSGRASFNQDIEHALFLASNGADLARCAAFLNRRYQEQHDEPVGFIGHFAAAQNAREEALELLSTAEQWLGERGVQRVIAPYSTLGQFGLRTAEHDASPLFPFRWHPPYYAGYLEEAGYRATYPWLSFRIDFGSERYREVSRRAIEDAQCGVRPFDKKRWHDDWALVCDLFNRTFQDEWEFYPLTVEEFREFFDPVKALFDPRQALFAEVDGEPVAFCLGSPDYNPLFRKARGKLGLLGQLRFALGARRTRGAGLWVVGVLPERRGIHIGQTLAATLYRRYQELGLDAAEYHIVNEQNLGSRALAESLGGEGRVLYHNYDRRLD
jgi:ribosomal protein S18 acetylase RimI-like enzyme